MYPESLNILLKDLLERLDSLLQDDCKITQQIELTELIHAAWMRLKNWESDIRNEDKRTLELLPELSSQTTEIVRSRMITLSQAIAEVESKVGSAEVGFLENLRIPVKDIFRAAVNISRLTRSLMRLVDPDYLSTCIKAVADSPIMDHNSMTTQAMPPTGRLELSIPASQGSPSAQPEQVRLPPPDDPKTSKTKMRIRDDEGPLYSEKKSRKEVTLASASDLSPSTINQNRPSAFSSLRMGDVIREKVQDGMTGEYKDLRYTQGKIVGNGSFGVVFRAKLSPSGEDVAIKRVLQDKRFKNRELQIMRIARHPNIAELKAFFYSNGEHKDEVYLNLVLEYVPETVYHASRYFNKMKTVMPILEVKLYIYQLFRSLAYIHSQGICHRDIKPQNLLLDPATGVMKLCDFGSAKILAKNESSVSYICSRYYRAPELIFGAVNYTTKIDVWSTGCVMAELMLGQPLFPGESGIDQLVVIIKVLGTPTRDQIHTMNPNYIEHEFPQIKPRPFKKVFRKADPNAIDLISKLLEYTPTQRLAAVDAMAQLFFDELRDPNTRLPDSRHPNGATRDLPDLFNFSLHELSIAPHLNRQLIPPHVRPRLSDQGLDFESPNFKPLTKEQMMKQLD